MTDLTINPDWLEAPYEVRYFENDRDLDYINSMVALRFKEADREAAIKAMQAHDSATLNRLAIRKYVEWTPTTHHPTTPP